MDFKYIITSQKYDPEVLKHPKRGSTKIERPLGLLWNVVDDIITALPKYNLFGSSRGKPLGPDLIEMDDELIMKLKITRLLFLRLSAQTYCRLGNLLGPLITCIKALSSRACEPLLFDHGDAALELYFRCDSLCSMAMLNCSTPRWN